MHAKARRKRAKVRKERAAEAGSLRGIGDEHQVELRLRLERQAVEAGERTVGVGRQIDMIARDLIRRHRIALKDAGVVSPIS